MLGTKILEERKSKFNGTLRVVRSFGLGTYIQANGLTQSGGIVEEFWKSTLRHILHTKYDVQNVLILGLGGGTVAKLVRKFWKEAKIIGLDIDPLMIELGEKYLGLKKDDIEIEIGDASQLSKKLSLKRKKFDLIIVDLYNGDKFPKKFESKNYIQLMRTVLQSTGVVVFNRLYYKNKKTEAEEFGQKLKKVFGKVDYFYPISNLMFICKN